MRSILRPHAHWFCGLLLFLTSLIWSFHARHQIRIVQIRIRATRERIRKLDPLRVEWHHFLEVRDFLDAMNQDPDREISLHIPDQLAQPTRMTVQDEPLPDGWTRRRYAVEWASVDFAVLSEMLIHLADHAHPWRVQSLDMDAAVTPGTGQLHMEIETLIPKNQSFAD